MRNRSHALDKKKVVSKGGEYVTVVTEYDSAFYRPTAKLTPGVKKTKT